MAWWDSKKEGEFVVESKIRVQKATAFARRDSFIRNRSYDIITPIVPIPFLD
jgi:hypothetical protein